MRATLKFKTTFQTSLSIESRYSGVWHLLHSTIKHIVTRLATVWTVTLPDLNATIVLVDNPIWMILGRARYWLIWKAAHEHTLCPYIMPSCISFSFYRRLHFLLLHASSMFICSKAKVFTYTLYFLTKVKLVKNILLRFYKNSEDLRMFREKVEIGVMWCVQRAVILCTTQKRSRKSRITVLPAPIRSDHENHGSL